MNRNKLSPTCDAGGNRFKYLTRVDDIGNEVTTQEHDRDHLHIMKTGNNVAIGGGMRNGCRKNDYSWNDIEPIP